MMKPKEYKLTEKVVDVLQVEDIIYAEFSAPGAMGACGTARVYVQDGNSVKFYLVDVMGEENKNSLETYGKIYSKLKNWGNIHKLKHSYGGYGNDAWKNPKITFSRDDDNSCFIFKKDDKVWQLRASCDGVYMNVVADFAKREMDIKKIDKYFEKIRDKLSRREAIFASVYIEQSKTKDTGGLFDFMVSEYWDAMQYMEFINLERFNLSAQEVYDGLRALEKYRLRYLLDRVGWNDLDAKMVEVVQNKRTDVFEALAELLECHPADTTLFNDNMEDFFAWLVEIQSSVTETSEMSSQNIESLFRYPVKVDFDKKANQEIIRKIMTLTPSELRVRTKSLAYYLANYLFHEDVWALMDVLPVACHIIERLPFDDYNHTGTAELYWLAGEAIDRAWRYLDESPEKQKKFRDLIYETYWPRIGSVWPIIHCEEFEFKDKAETKMFEDTLGFVMSLDDIAERNPNLGEYLKSSHIPSEKVARRAFVNKLKPMKPEERFEEIIAKFESWEWHTYLRYPENKDEAKILLDELMRDDEDAPFKGIVRMEMFEQLLLTPNPIGVGEYVLKYLNDNFAKWVEATNADCEIEDEDFADVMGSYYSALAGGITEENEFPPMKLLHDKMIKIGVKAELCDAVAKVARKRRRMILFQRSALEKFF